MIAAAIPALVVAASGSASADDWVSWKNAKSGKLLIFGISDHLGEVKGGVPGTGWDYEWWDIQNSDGSW
ncbi:hypothetical protein AB0O42_35850, partial [Streptomyces sp. NPDC089922]